MNRTDSSQQADLEEGRRLARRLYDYDLNELKNLQEEERRRLRGSFPHLNTVQFNDVLRQVIAAKHQERAQVGWQSVPHDVAVIVTVVITGLGHLKAGLAAGVGVLVLLEGLSMTIFEERLYRPLSLLVWLTYPAYALLAYTLYRQGYEFLEIVGIVLFVWPGMFLLGALARLPLYLLWEERRKQQEPKR